MLRVENLLGGAVKARRRQIGLSQEKIAHRAELSLTYVSQIERGLRSPTLGAFIRLAGALEISPAQLLEQITEGLAGDAGSN